MRVAVMGQDCVGLPLAMAAVGAGHHVIGFETDTLHLKWLSAGDSYIEEVPREMLRAALKSGRYSPTSDKMLLVGFDVAVIAVSTPLKERLPDLSAVRLATETLARYVRRGVTVILESTPHPGTTRQIVLPILEALSWMRAGAGFHLGFSPARIDPGSGQRTFANTPKIVSGLTEECRDRVQEFYAGITQNVVLAGSLEEAELVKESSCLTPEPTATACQ